MEKVSTSPHAVLVSSPGMGHLTAVLELAKRLSSVHSIKATVLFVSTGGHTRLPLAPCVDLIEIPAADISNMVGPGAQVVTKIFFIMRETAPLVHAAIAGLTATFLIFDMFATGYLPIARELALPTFVYVPSNAWFLALTVYCPLLDKKVEGEYVEQTKAFDIPGCKPVKPLDVVEPMWKREDRQYTEYVRFGLEIPLFDGVLSNTWQELEGSTLAALRDGDILPVPVYDVGPIVAEPYSTGGNDEMLLMEWLDCQPTQSVIYVSFGSGGTLSAAQMNEVARGLELSQQRFVWVVRPPMDGDASGTYLGLKGGDMDDYRYLPHDFLYKTRDFGRLVPQWAPQLKVLSHPSVGGFLTHCGWNSIIESLTKGVPMMAWPMYAEQRMNATMLVEVLKVAVRTSELPGIKVIGREEIGKMVRVLLKGEEGRRMRLRAQELQKSATQALSHSGTSYMSLFKLLQTL